MRYTCSACVKASIVNLLKESKLICKNTAYFTVIKYPNISLTQRYCINEFRNKIRIIIKVLNFENECYQNICLCNKIYPDNLNVIINKSSGEIIQENNSLIVRFPCIPPLSVQTVELEVEVRCCGEISSITCLKECISGITCEESIRKSICKIII